MLLNVTTPKFGSQALAADAKMTDWNPLHILNNVAAVADACSRSGSEEHLQGVVSSTYYKDPVDPQWEDDAEMKLYN